MGRLKAALQRNGGPSSADELKHHVPPETQKSIISPEPGHYKPQKCSSKNIAISQPNKAKNAYAINCLFLLFFFHSLIIRHDKTLLKAVVTLSNHSCEV